VPTVERASTPIFLLELDPIYNRLQHNVFVFKQSSLANLQQIRNVQGDPKK